MKETISHYWQHKPLTTVLVIGFLARLVSVVFSKGYAMHDDHFLLMESSSSWIHGYNFDYWLNEGLAWQVPTGHSFFYAGIHYIILQLLELVGIDAPNTQMYFIRFIHATYSLLIIYLGYRMAEKIKGVEAARVVGLILGLFWLMPMFSVRNLVEMVCIPPLMAATWVLLKRDGDYRWQDFVWVGLLGAASVAIRIQTGTFLFGIGLVLLYQRKIVGAAIMTLAFVAGYFMTQVYDVWNWGRPFAEIQEYINYNIINAETYVNHVKPWHFYIPIVMGALLPPVSVFIVLGFFKNWKQHLIIFVPTLVFFVFHSYFPNKQERFIVPFLPFIVTLGYCGWAELKENSFWSNKKKFITGSWIFALVVNTIMLAVFSTSYNKRARVESMLYLSKQADFVNLIEEATNEYARGSGAVKLPQYYLEQYDPYFVLDHNKGYEGLQNELQNLPDSLMPNYAVFPEIEDLEMRVQKFEEEIGELELVFVAEPSFYDKLIYSKNKVNRNDPCYVYKIKSYK